MVKHNLIFTAIFSLYTQDISQEIITTSIFDISLKITKLKIIAAPLRGNETTRFNQQFDELVQERRNSIVNTLELRLSCTNPSNCTFHIDITMTS